jgi:hypothetical protein
MLQSSWFKLIWIVGSIAGALFFFINADDMKGSTGEILGALCIISFIGAIVYTGQKRGA